MRRLIYYVACTVDRFIAREDGSFDFFPMEGEHLTDLIASFPETIPGHLREALGARDEKRWFDTILIGRRTYEVGLDVGVTSPYPQLRQYVVSRTMKASPDGEVTLVSGDPLALVKELKKEEGQGIWLCGGADLATTLSPEIDELILKVSPILLGSGIPLFSGTVEQTDLELAGSTIYDSGFMLLRYRLRR